MGGNGSKKYISHKNDKPFKAYDGDESFIFISYAHKDSREVYPIIDKFHKRGFNIWYDDALVPGVRYKEKIVEAIVGCSLFVVFISDNALKSAFMGKELQIACEEQHPIFPIYLEDVKLTPQFRLDLAGTQSVMQFEYNDEETFIEECIQGIIANEVGTSKFEQEEPPEPEEPEELEEPEEPSEPEEPEEPQKPVEPKKSEEPKVAPKPLDKNFHDLNDLIHSGESKIILDANFVLGDGEHSSFIEGIDVDVDSLVIDGNNHSIDAKGLARIFNVTANDVVIKNISFKNGLSKINSSAKHENGGGAIHIDEGIHAELTNCNFLQNQSENDGGAIFNRGNLNIQKCSFEKNSSKVSGGAISNFKTLIISKSVFENNDSGNGGTIYNFHDSTLTLRNCKLKGNSSSMFAAGVYNYGKLNVYDTNFRKNNSKIGGAISNYGATIANSCTFRENSAEFGGAVFNMDIMRLKDYAHDDSHFGTGEGIVNLEECNFASNEASQLGGAICNLNKCKLERCNIGKNFAKQGYIVNNGPEGIFNEMSNLDMEGHYYSVFDMSECELLVKPKLAKDAIYNQKNCLLKVSDDNTLNNQELDENDDLFLNNGKMELY